VGTARTINESCDAPEADRLSGANTEARRTINAEE